MRSTARRRSRGDARPAAIAAVALAVVLLSEHAIHTVRADCTSTDGLGAVSDCPVATVNGIIYVLPPVCRIQGGGDAPCHYKCDTQGSEGWQVDLNASHALESDVNGIAYASGTFGGPEPREAIFLLGGAKGLKRINTFRIFAPDAPEPLQEIEELRLPKGLRYASAAVLSDVLYVFGGQDPLGVNAQVLTLDLTQGRKGRWSSNSAPNMPEPRWGMAIAVLGSSIFTIGGQNGREYVTTVEVLDVQLSRNPSPGVATAAASTSDGELAFATTTDSTPSRQYKWSGASSISKERAFAAAFVMNCRIYIAGGATTLQPGQKFNYLDTVEIYHVKSGASIAQGAWSTTSSLRLQLAHIAGVTLVGSGGGQKGLLIGGQRENDPELFLDTLSPACAADHDLEPNSSPEPARCASGVCGIGFIKTGLLTCAACPGTGDFPCTSGCGDAYGRSGVCNVTGGEATCDCAPFFTGKDCDTCVERRTGPTCTDCVAGHTGPTCEPCPGVNITGLACSGHGACSLDGKTSPGGGDCDCDSGWDVATACSQCLDEYWGPSCQPCSCDDVLRNDTARAQCSEQSLCSGHGHCVLPTPSKSSLEPLAKCQCDKGWESDFCDRQEQPLGAGPIVGIVVGCLLGVGAIVYFGRGLIPAGRQGRTDSVVSDKTPLINNASANPVPVYQAPAPPMAGPPASSSGREFMDSEAAFQRLMNDSSRTMNSSDPSESASGVADGVASADAVNRRRSSLDDASGGGLVL